MKTKSSFIVRRGTGIFKHIAKNLILLSVSLLLFFFVLPARAQAPLSFSYQAVARDGSAVLKNITADVRLSLLQGTETGSEVWTETHTITTTDFGLFSIEAGSVTPIDIDWGTGPYYLKTEIDRNDGNGFVLLGTSPVLAVPYALFAEDVANKDDADADATNEIQNLQLSGDTLFITGNSNPFKVDLSAFRDTSVWTGTGSDTISYSGSVGIGTSHPLGSKLSVQGENIYSEDPLFEVKRKDGQPVFAVYNEGVRIFVDTTQAKGPRGGFAIGGFGASKGSAYEYLRVTPDSVRIYINPNEAKGPRGGFAIGGYGAAKGDGNQYLSVSQINTVVTTGTTGHFQVNNDESGITTSYLNLTKDNYFISHEAGSAITSGLYNLFLGFNAGMGTTTGSYNSFFGYQSGYSNTTGKYNMFMGYQAGYNNIGSSYWAGNYNSFLGYKTGYTNTTGGQNVFLGYMSGYLNHTGSNNVFIGNNTGYNNDASNNVFVGNEVGRDNTSGTANVFLGAQAGLYNQTGSYNVYLGSVAGVNNIDGDANIFIGDHAGYQTTTGDRNIFFGYLSGMNFISGGSNVMVGEMAGTNFDQGVSNVFIGPYAGYGGSTGDNSGNWNVFIGYSVGSDITTGNRNIAFGSSAAAALTTGNDNILMGYHSGYGLVTGSYNVHIGYYAGNYETGSNTFYLDTKYRTSLSSQRSSALMYGNFSSSPGSQYLRINAHVGVNVAASPSYALYISGSAYASGGTWQTSDIRMKKNVVPVADPLQKIMSTRGVYFDWKKDEYPDLHLSDRKQVGFIAQELEEVFPEVVNTDAEGYKTVDYAKMTTFLVEGMKAQQKMLEAQQKRIEELERRISQKE